MTTIAQQLSSQTVNNVTNDLVSDGSTTMTSDIAAASGIDYLRYEMCSNLSNTENITDIAFCVNSSSGNIPFESEEDYRSMEKIVAYVVILLFSLTVVVGLIGNSLVVIVVAFNQQMRSTTNLLIINLAIADLLFICCCVPFTATDYVLPYWPFGDLWCKMVQYLIVVTAYASVYTLVLMSLDRFLAVVHPIVSMSIRTEKNALTAILITWAVILILAVPVLYRHGEVTYTYSSEEHTVCVFLDQDPISRPDGYSQPVYQVGAAANRSLFIHIYMKYKCVSIRLFRCRQI